MELLNELVKKNQKVKMCLVGKEFDKKPRELADSLELQNNITFVGPIYDGIEKFYSAFDICLLPSKNEGMSLSFLESLASSVYSLYSSAVPKTEFNMKSNNYLELDKAIWVKTIEMIIEKSLYKNRNKKSILENTNYDLNVFASNYINLYYNYVEIKDKIK